MLAPVVTCDERDGWPEAARVTEADWCVPQRKRAAVRPGSLMSQTLVANAAAEAGSKIRAWSTELLVERARLTPARVKLCS